MFRYQVPLPVGAVVPSLRHLCPSPVRSVTKMRSSGPGVDSSPAVLLAGPFRLHGINLRLRIGNRGHAAVH